jgi:hypothetical protein
MMSYVYEFRPLLLNLRGFVEKADTAAEACLCHNSSDVTGVIQGKVLPSPVA